MAAAEKTEKQGNDDLSDKTNSDSCRTADGRPNKRVKLEPPSSSAGIAESVHVRTSGATPVPFPSNDVGVSTSEIGTSFTTGAGWSSRPSIVAGAGNQSMHPTGSRDAEMARLAAALIGASGTANSSSSMPPPVAPNAAAASGHAIASADPKGTEPFDTLLPAATSDRVGATQSVVAIAQPTAPAAVSAADRRMTAAAEAIAEADAVVVLCGAGMSAGCLTTDGAVLPDYRTPGAWATAFPTLAARGLRCVRISFCLDLQATAGIQHQHLHKRLA
jgi:hypothetical protein